MRLAKSAVEAMFVIIINLLVMLVAISALEDKAYFSAFILVLATILADVGVFYLASLETN